MPEYRRFISYIYEYQSGKKGKNCGYVKVEIRNGVCRLRLHMQDSGRLAGALGVYAFVRADGEQRGILLGSASPANNVLDFQASTPASAVSGTEYSMDDVRGIWLRGEQQENYITVWDDEPVAVDGFRPPAQAVTAAGQAENAGNAENVEYAVGAESAEDAGNAETQSAQAAPGVTAAGRAEDARDAESTEDTVDAESAEDTGDVDTRNAPGVTAAERAEDADMQAAPGAMAGGVVSGGAMAAGSAGDGAISADAVAAGSASGSLWSRWDNFLRHYPQIRPFADDEIPQCIAITPKDISYLQRSEWQFIRNTFVRQAYIRFRHLMLGCHRSGRFVLAVPGTDDSQERHMARMHGFLYYKEASADPAAGGEICAAEGERRALPQGYWYRFLNEKWPC